MRVKNENDEEEERGLRLGPLLGEGTTVERRYRLAAVQVKTRVYDVSQGTRDQGIKGAQCYFRREVRRLQEKEVAIYGVYGRCG